MLLTLDYIRILLVTSSRHIKIHETLVRICGTVVSLLNSQTIIVRNSHVNEILA